MIDESTQGDPPTGSGEQNPPTISPPISSEEDTLGGDIPTGTGGGGLGGVNTGDETGDPPTGSGD